MDDDPIENVCALIHANRCPTLREDNEELRICLKKQQNKTKQNKKKTTKNKTKTKNEFI